MKCPVCSVELVMSERQGVEIDYCPKCRGVWLDRGELDKIIEKSASYTQEEHREKHDDHDKHGHDEYKKHKRRSLLGDLFD
jgi:Zn-finger nucleic acid-binding protein